MVDDPVQWPRHAHHLEPNRITVETEVCRLVDSRDDPRAAFRGYTRETPWDDLTGRWFMAKRRGIIQPPSASNIPIPRANAAQRCGARCVEDDPSRRTPERSSDDYKPHDRSSQYGNAVFDFPASRIRLAPALWHRRKPAGSVPCSD